MAGAHGRSGHRPSRARSSDEICEPWRLGWSGTAQSSTRSRRTGRYAEALQALRTGELTFECSCSRRELHGAEKRATPARAAPDRSQRADGDALPGGQLGAGAIRGRIQGRCDYELGALERRGHSAPGRRVCLPAGLVVDDAAQHIPTSSGVRISWRARRGRSRCSAAQPALPKVRASALIVEPARGNFAKSRRSVRSTRLQPARN